MLIQKVASNLNTINLNINKWYNLVHLFLVCAYKNNRLDKYDSSSIDVIISEFIDQVAKRPFKHVTKDSINYEGILKCYLTV